MKVSIDHKEVSHGLVFKTQFTAVVVSVTFSDEEKAIIQQRKLSKYIVLERGPDAYLRSKFEVKDPKHLASLGGLDLSIANLLKGPDTYECQTPMHAKEYEGKVTEALKTLKGFIMGNAQKEESKSFEL